MIYSWRRVTVRGRNGGQRVSGHVHQSLIEMSQKKKKTRVTRIGQSGDSVCRGSVAGYALFLGGAGAKPPPSLERDGKEVGEVEDGAGCKKIGLG